MTGCTHACMHIISTCECFQCWVIDSGHKHQKIRVQHNVQKVFPSIAYNVRCPFNENTVLHKNGFPFSFLNQCLSDHLSNISLKIKHLNADELCVCWLPVQLLVETNGVLLERMICLCRNCCQHNFKVCKLSIPLRRMSTKFNFLLFHVKIPHQP